MRGVLLLLLCSAASCSPQPPLVPCDDLVPFDGGNFGNGGGPGGPGEAQPPAVVGKSFAVTLALPLVCKRKNVADELFTEVFDPLNRKVAHTRTELIFGVSPFTRLTFTPVVAGSHHVSARFEPALGTVQTEVLALVEHSEPPTKTYALGVQCTALEVTPSGLVLCLTSADTLRVYRDDVLLQTLDADDFALAGAVVWTTRLGVIQRRVELPGATLLGSELGFDTGLGNPGTLLATESEAVLITRSDTVKVRLAAAALVEAARVAAGTGERAVVQPPAGLDRLFFVSGRTAYAPAQLCSMPVPNPEMIATCRRAGTPEPLGSDRTGIWSREGRLLRHDSYLVADGGLATTTFNFTGLTAPAEVPRHFQSTPSFSFNGLSFVPRLGAEGISLEAWPLEAGYTAMPGSPTTVRHQHSDGRQKLFTR